MASRQLVHSEVFVAQPDRVFSALVTPSAICQWWSARKAIVVPRQGGSWSAAWGEDDDAPDYVTSARILEYDPPRRIVLGDFQYVARMGRLPFEADFVNSFVIESAPPDSCRLTICQSGFPEDPVADAHFEACRAGWIATMSGLRRFLEGPDASPPA